MGFSSLATYVILFAVGMSMVIGLLLVYKDFFVKSSESFELRQKMNSDKLQSNLEILNFTYSFEYKEKNLTVDTQEDFEAGISENISTTENVGWIRLANDNLTGTWYSEIYNLNYSLNFTDITIEGNDFGASTDIDVQIRSAKTTSELVGDFLGPDGTSNTFYSLEGASPAIIAINETHNSDSVIQLKVNLKRTITNREPEVDYLVIGYKISYISELAIKNTGKIRLDKDVLDYFIDGDRIPRTKIVSTIIRNETDILNPGLWDPEEIISVNISQPITLGNHIVNVINEQSIKDSLAIIV